MNLTQYLSHPSTTISLIIILGFLIYKIISDIKSNTHKESKTNGN